MKKGLRNLLAVGALAGLVGIITAENQKVEEPPVQEMKFSKKTARFEDAKAGRIPLVPYLEEVANTVPEFVEAKNSGLLKYLLFEPTTEQVREVFEEFYKDESPNVRRFMVESSLVNYVTSNAERDKHGDTIALIKPSALINKGKNKKGYALIFRKGVKKDEYTDAEIASTIRHELRHLDQIEKPFYVLDGIEITAEMVATSDQPMEDKLRPAFLEPLFELDALSTEIEYAFSHMNGNQLAIGPEYLQRRFQYYHHSLERAKGMKKSKLEERVLDYCLTRLKTIEFTETPKTLKVKVHPNGKDYDFMWEYKKPE